MKNRLEGKTHFHWKRVSNRRHIRRVWDTLYINVSLSLPRRASRFSICGAMRRIFYLYIITHIARRPFSYPPSPSRPPLVLSFPFSAPGPSSLSSFLVFPTLLVLSFSRHLSLPPATSRHVVYLFYFIIKQTSSCHPRANMRLYTYMGSTSNTVSTWREDQLTRPFQTRKIFFLYSPLRSRYHSPFTCIKRYLRALGGAYRDSWRDSILKGSSARLKRN